MAEAHDSLHAKKSLSQTSFGAAVNSMRPTLLAILNFALLGASVQVADMNCALDDQNLLSRELPQLKSWHAIYRAYERYSPQCDDGFIAEGYTEAVVVLLATNWSSLQELAAICKGDANFERFFLRHIDSSADADELRRIRWQATTQCSPKYQVLCTSIASAASTALEAP